jgi:hypothetical protein
MEYPDGVTYWDKQEDIHKDAHISHVDVHEGPAFIPWHRELVNRFERLLRKVDNEISLHYWDWTQDPRRCPDRKGGFINLFTEKFMGNANGDAGPPLQNFESTEWTEIQGNHHFIWRNVKPGPLQVASDHTIVTFADHLPDNIQFSAITGRDSIRALHTVHDLAHNYIGGTIGFQHYSFHDPFVFLLHSNMDRLWAMWQTVPSERNWRTDPEKVYGIEGNSDSINSFVEPWNGEVGTRPWSNPADWQGDPDSKAEKKTFKDKSIVTPPRYDTNLS